MIARSRGRTQGRYKIQTLSELSGYQPERLRAWETRHGLLQPSRTPGGQRLYTDEDLSVLRRVRELSERGLRIGEIAARGRDGLLDPEAGPEPGPPPNADPTGLRGDLVRAAVEVDADLGPRTVDLALAQMPPLEAFDRVFEPALQEIGRLWERGACSIAGEHLVSTLISDRAHRLRDAARPLPGAPLAVFACLPVELHETGLASVALRAALRGLRVLYLGPNLPLAEFARIVFARRPEFALLSVSRPATLAYARADLLRFLRRVPGSTRAILGGAGIRAGDVAWIERAGGRVLTPGGFTRLLEDLE